LLHENRVLNWHPGLRSVPLDIHHAPKLLQGALTLIDMEAAGPAIFDQGQEGSCTANAVTGVFELKERLNGYDLGPGSRQAIYALARAMRGNLKHDTGSTISDTMAVVLKYGLPSEAICPYSVGLVTTLPGPDVLADGLKRRPDAKMIVRVHQDMANLWNTLSEDDPIAFGFTVYTSFMSGTMAKSGIWHGHQKGDKVEGGHAVALIGYSPMTRMFKCRNSWGAGWGIRGTFWLPQDFVLSQDCDDFMAAVDAPKVA
jgi:hypothetical protein